MNDASLAQATQVAARNRSRERLRGLRGALRFPLINEAWRPGGGRYLDGKDWLPEIWSANIFFPPFQCFLCITPIISFCPLPSQQVAHMAPDSWECWHCFGSRAKVTRSWPAVCFSLLNNITAEIFEMIYRIHTYTNCISLSLWWWWLLFLNNNYCCIIIYVSSRHSGTCLDGLQGNSGLCNS